MLFNSFQFAIFLPVVFALYWLLNKNIKAQNMWLLFSSCIFYGWWDYRFLLLLAGSVTTDFILAKWIFDTNNGRHKKLLLWLSISINLSVLVLFKYSNFFISSFTAALHALHINADPICLKLILPLGISFYTFHELSYIIDIYKGRITPVKNYIDYALFVTFFPLLVAGPIERATHLLPQLQKERQFNYAKATDGLRQILWGLFKKIVIADNCADIVNTVFNNPGGYPASAHIIAATFFAFQIYCDFSGYSDIAIGTARLLGIDLIKNFAFPYFSRDIAEFWRRWHISLTTWFRDYLYIPLGGSRVKRIITIRNTFIVFLISGFWHGANWTFILWGVINFLYFLPLLVSNKNRSNLDNIAAGKFFPSASDFFKMLMTFSLTVLAWIFFRAKNIHVAKIYITGIFNKSLLHTPGIITSTPLKSMALMIVLFLVIEWLGRENEYALEKIMLKMNKTLRWCIYLLLICIIFIWYKNPQEFIYFHF